MLLCPVPLLFTLREIARARINGPRYHGTKEPSHTTNPIHTHHAARIHTNMQRPYKAHTWMTMHHMHVPRTTHASGSTNFNHEKKMYALQCYLHFVSLPNHTSIKSSATRPKSHNKEIPNSCKREEKFHPQHKFPNEPHCVKCHADSPQKKKATPTPPVWIHNKRDNLQPQTRKTSHTNRSNPIHLL